MNTWELIEALCKKPDIEILESFGPCDGAFQVLETVKQLRVITNIEAPAQTTV